MLPCSSTTAGSVKMVQKGEVQGAGGLTNMVVECWWQYWVSRFRWSHIMFDDDLLYIVAVKTEDPTFTIRFHDFYLCVSWDYLAVSVFQSLDEKDMVGKHGSNNHLRGYGTFSDRVYRVHCNCTVFSVWHTPQMEKYIGFNLFRCKKILTNYLFTV